MLINISDNHLESFSIDCDWCIIAEHMTTSKRMNYFVEVFWLDCEGQNKKSLVDYQWMMPCWSCMNSSFDLSLAKLVFVYDWTVSDGLFSWKKEKWLYQQKIILPIFFSKSFRSLLTKSVLCKRSISTKIESLLGYFNKYNERWLTKISRQKILVLMKRILIE